MKDANKEGSFLYTLYQKYVKKQTQPESERAKNGAELLAETVKEIQKPQLPPEKQYLQPLYDLYLSYVQDGLLETEPLDCLAFEDWCLAPVKALEDYAVKRAGIISFEKLLCKDAVQLLQERDEDKKKLNAAAQTEEDPVAEPVEEAPTDTDNEATASAAPETESEAEPAPEPLTTDAIAVVDEVVLEPRDAFCKTYITGDKMTAYLVAIPARNGGLPLDQECIVSSLEQAGIVYGLDTEVMGQLAEGQHYLQIFQIAQGTAPVPGKDGELIPQIDYSNEIEIRQDERGVSDFKNINLVRCLSKDQIICVLMPPVEGVPGKDVKGTAVAAYNGKTVPDPSGKNTVLSEDKTRLLATVDGQVTLKHNKYHVEPVLVINGNVDYSVGNLQFNGDIIIKGDVCNGFTVKADGSVTVHGMVESADIISGGDVSISKGMNGNFSGLIDAKGEVKTSFLENCTVYAEGCLHADSIISSKIFCGDTVYVLTKHGAIIGGTITALNAVEAKVIGSQSRRETDIVLGEIPRMSEKKAEAEAELKSVSEVLNRMDQNLKFLKGKEKTLPPDKLEILQQLNLQHALYASRMDELTEFLTEAASVKRDFSDCRVKCGQLYPPTKVCIGSDVTLFKENATKCMIYRGPEGLVLGTL